MGLLRIIGLAAMLTFSGSALAEGDWQAAPEDWQVTVLGESDVGLQLRVSLQEAFRGQHAQLQVVEGEDQPLVVGRMLALPPTASAVLEVVSLRWSDGQVADAPPCTLSDPVLWLGQRVVGLSVTPLRADGAVVEELELELRFTSGSAINPGQGAGPRSRVQLERARQQLLNPGLVARQLDARTGELPLGRYLVVGKTASLPYMNDWATWRRRQGYDVTLMSAEALGVTGNDWEPIRTAAQNMAATEGLDYLLLVGDMNLNQADYHLPGDMVPGGQYAETAWSRNIITDHPLAMLEGDDYFSDVIVGRFPADNANQVSIMATRALLYDQQPLVAGADWLKSAVMIYDVSSAGSRREISMAIRQHLFEAGFAEVDTIWNNRDTDPQSPTLVTNSINDGRAFVNYRGYGYRYSWNGPLFGVTQIGQLANYGQYPVVTSIVCGGGDFASANYDPCLGEAFLRAGSPVEPMGAVAFMGPSEEDTHTKWNNAINLGIYQGLLREGIRDVGALLERGKAELWNCFPNDREQVWYDPGSASQATNVPFYFYCYNLLGDPGTRVRMGDQHTVDIPGWAPPATGSTHLELVVVDDMGQPAQGLWACLTNATGERLAMGRSDAEGRVVLDVTPLEASAHTLVVHGDDWIPLQLAFTPQAAQSNVVLESWEAQGDDSLLSAGDVFSLAVGLREAGSVGSAAGRQLVAQSLDEQLTVVDGQLELPELAAGQAMDLEGFSMSLSSSTEDGRILPFTLTLTEQDGTPVWERHVSVTASGPRPVVELLQLTPATPAPGAEVAILLGLRNAGPLTLDADSCRLYALSTACELVDEGGSFMTLDPDADGEAGPFRVRLSEDLVDGMQTALELVFFRPDGSTAARLPFAIQVGSVGLTDPVGPDDYGYLIYHHNDSADLAPTFNYNDIAQEGTEVILNDEGVAWNEDGLDGASRVVALPFTFRFYGQDYDTITVNSNGWIAMGDQSLHIVGMNTPIPAAQGPNAMVAVFWTDLYNYYSNSRFGHCYRYYDAAQHTLTIQWDNFQHTGHPYQDNWFQCVLRDPAYWPTPTGDGELLLQYDDLVTTFGDMFYTVGVERQDQMAGLQYTFNGDYSAAAQPVVDQTALLITTATPFQETGVAPSLRPAGLELFEAVPNPFNPETVLHLNVRAADPVRLDVFNLRGERVRRLHDGPLAAGSHAIRFDARGLAAGVYLVEARQAGRSAVQRVCYLP